jgi:hypothetical protein
MYYKRTLEPRLRALAGMYSCVLVTGIRLLLHLLGFRASDLARESPSFGAAPALSLRDRENVEKSASYNARS